MQSYWLTSYCMSLSTIKRFSFRFVKVGISNTIQRLSTVSDNPCMRVGRHTDIVANNAICFQCHVTTLSNANLLFKGIIDNLIFNVNRTFWLSHIVHWLRPCEEHFLMPVIEKCKHLYKQYLPLHRVHVNGPFLLSPQQCHYTVQGQSQSRD